MTYPGADRFLPEKIRLSDLRRAARACRGCDLYESATQVVFGAGLVKSRMMLVGEQPGDVEDRRGEPFVGPAGQVLDRALDAAEIERSEIYLTNAVKHFRWKATESTSRRLHATPSARQIAACRSLAHRRASSHPADRAGRARVGCLAIVVRRSLSAHSAPGRIPPLAASHRPLRRFTAIDRCRPGHRSPVRRPAGRRPVAPRDVRRTGSRPPSGSRSDVTPARSALYFDQLDDALDRHKRGRRDDHRNGDTSSIPDRPPVEGDHRHAKAVRHRDLG